MKIYGVPLLMGGGGGNNATLPPLLDNFAASRDGETITITASKLESSRAEHLAGAVWIYADHIPQKVSDGTKIELTKNEIVGSSDETITKTIQWGAETDFYVRQFTYNEKKQYQTMLDGAVAIPSFKPKGQPISNLPSKSFVKLGKYNDTVLKWKVCRVYNTQDMRLLLDDDNVVSVLGKMFFDAPEPNNSNSSMKNYGNGRYIWSNIHQWLNATNGANQWYTAQHSADAPPEYQNQPGFLNAWDKKDLDALRVGIWRVTQRKTIGNGSETFYSKIALIAGSELGDTDYDRGNDSLDIFRTLSDRTFAGYYVTRDYNTTRITSDVLFFQKDGTPYNGSGGTAFDIFYIRPLCQPNPDTLVSLSPDSDGCYTIV